MQRALIDNTIGLNGGGSLGNLGLCNLVRPYKRASCDPRGNISLYLSSSNLPLDLNFLKNRCNSASLVIQ